MSIAALTFAGIAWWWVAVLGLAIVLPLAWLALQPSGQRSATLAVGLGLRTLGVGLLLVCLLDPQWTSHRPRAGANLLAIVADNSQGLQVTETGATQSRGQQLQAALSGKNSSWLPPLGEIFQLRTYSFDRDLRRVRDFSELDFKGERTDLGQALGKLRERFSGQPLAGIVLFTDGNATDLTAGLPDLTGLPPIYPVVVGNPGATRDVRVDRADVRQSAFDDAPVTLNVQVGGAHEDGRDVAVSQRLAAVEGHLSHSERDEPVERPRHLLERHFAGHGRMPVAIRTRQVAPMRQLEADRNGCRFLEYTRAGDGD